MTKKILLVFTIFLMQISIAFAGSEDSESLSKSKTNGHATECFEKTSRAFFKFNQGLDRAIFKPVAMGYRKIPQPVRKGTNNVVQNLRSLLTFSNNLLQGDLKGAGNTAGRFLINSTVGILGIWDPAEAAFGLKKQGKEDFGQTLGVWGSDSGCYFVLPILGPTTTRDAVGLVGNVFLDPIFHVTHDSEMMGKNFSEHNYYYYRGTGSVDFRSKNIESFDSLERNSIDLYASVKSLYLQNRNQKISNSEESAQTQGTDDWEEIDSQ